MSAHRKLLAAVLAFCMCVAGLVATSSAAYATTGFTLFDNTAYSSVTIGHGSVKSNLVPNSTCSPLVAGGAMPTEADWQAIVEADDVNPDGPLVLDCENLYLTGSATTAATHYSQLSQLQSWARAVEPDQVIGWYGLLGNTSTAYQSYYQDLIALDANTAFFPSAYTFSASEENWDSTLAGNIATATAISSSTPMYPYIWPQYHVGSSPSSLDLTFVPAAQWSVELATIEEEGLSGAVVWGGLSSSGTCDSTCEADAGSQGWLTKTQNYLDFLATPRTDVAVGDPATASSTNVTGRGPDMAVDADPMTRWGSQYSDPQWIMVDLGADYDIDGVRLMWETAYATSYLIQTSEDASTWTTIYSTTSGAGGVTFHPTAVGTGRYVRVYATARGTSYGDSLWDFDVYGSPA